MKWHRPLAEGIIGMLWEIFGTGKQADHVVERTFKAHRKWGARDRRAVADSVYYCVRWWRRLWASAGLAEADFLQPAAMTPEHCRAVWLASLIERGVALPDFPEAPTATYRPLAADTPPAIAASWPDWLWEMGAADYGAAWPTLAAQLNAEAAVFLRANTLRLSPADLQATLAREDIAADRIEGTDALRVAERRTLGRSATAGHGLWEIQDLGSQKIAAFADVSPGMTVVDACAGAGGKSLHLACLMKNRGRLLALDVRDAALAELERRAARAHASVIETRTVLPDAPIDDLLARADVVLIDAPCSGLGVLRRHPWAKWTTTASQLDTLIRTQASLLALRSRMVRPGGTLVYATCSFLRIENEAQTAAFLAQHPQFRLVAESRPDAAVHDAFYAAKFKRTEPDSSG
jgi:16S rRNA (cytosine967-C5)-methyltransferase